MKMDESISVSSTIDKLPALWKDFKHNLKHQKGELTLVERGSHFRIEEGLRAQEKLLVNDEKKPAGTSSVNMVETGEPSKGNSKFKGKQKFQGNNNSGPNKKPNFPCWKCGKVGHFKRDCKLMKNTNKFGSKNKNEAGSNGSKDPGK
ncbi:putative transcription factor interactor and regulator CCHC(Zn) family [Helianthus annuus]|nr:putative transcription factor interactor and regulator CCHC(Zn) family [Helianthus annuus]